MSDNKSDMSQVQLYLMCWLRGRASAGLRGHYTSLCLEELSLIAIATNIHIIIQVEKGLIIQRGDLYLCPH